MTPPGGRLERATPARSMPDGYELECFRGKVRIRGPRAGRVTLEAETELGATLGLELTEQDLRGLEILCASVWARLTGAGS